jgi:hypothetical protein
MSDIEGKAATIAASEAGAERVSMDTNRHESTGLIFEPDFLFVIPSEVEKRVAREAARLTGKPKAERVGSERIKSLNSCVRL